MRLVILFLILVVGPTSWAFQYQIESRSFTRPSLIKAQGLSDIFASEGLWSVRGASFIHARMPFDWVYVNQNWDKALLVKEGLRAPSEHIGRRIRMNNNAGSVFHFEHEGSNYVLVALGFSDEELRSVLARLKLQGTFSKWSLFLNSANAASCALANSAVGGIAQSAAQLDAGMVLRSIGQCGADALQGVANSGEKTLDFFTKLATDPAALWDEMKTSFLSMKEFVLNFKDEVQNIVAQFSGMTSEQKLQMVCTITGEIIGGTAQSMVAFSAAAKLFPVMLLKLRQAAGLLGRMSELSKQGIRFPELNLATKEILSCAY